MFKHFALGLMLLVLTCGSRCDLGGVADVLGDIDDVLDEHCLEVSDQIFCFDDFDPDDEEIEDVDDDEIEENDDGE